MSLKNNLKHAKHRSICIDVRTVCALLSTSKCLRAAAVEHCNGKISVASACDSSTAAAQQSSWIADHGALLQMLCLEFDQMERSDLAAASAGVAAGLQAAASASPGLRLQQATFTDVDANIAGLLLQQLPASHLTSLWLQTAAVSATTPVDARDKLPDSCSKSLARALAGLTKLEELTLRHIWQRREETYDSWDDHLPTPPQVLAALPALTALTSLDLILCSKQQLSCLRQLSNLQELALLAAMHSPHSPLQLRQLTGLTSLYFCGYYFGSDLPDPLVLEAGDVLPPKIQDLCLADCNGAQSLESLSRLRNLQVLSVTSLSVLADVLQCSVSLTNLSLRYATAPRTVADQVPPHILAVHLKKSADSLHNLSITDIPSSAAVVATAQVVQHLTGLETLSVLCLEYTTGSELVHFESAALRQLITAVAGLPRLKDLTLCGVAVDDEAAKQLALCISTRLESLTLQRAKLNDFQLSTVCCGLTQLTELCVCGNQELAMQGLLPWMVKAMPNLDKLSIDPPTLQAFTPSGRELFNMNWP
eukprot:gene5386-5622_t